MSDQEDDDRIRRGIGHIFSPDWSHDLGKRIGEAAKRTVSPEALARAKDMARQYVDAMDPHGAARRADEELEANRQKIAIMQQYAQPKDLGDIDEAPVRQPVMQERGFSNEQEKEAYLQRIRDAQAAVGKK